jgi:hypothetical protein
VAGVADPGYSCNPECQVFGFSRGDLLSRAEQTGGIVRFTLLLGARQSHERFFDSLKHVPLSIRI